MKHVFMAVLCLLFYVHDVRQNLQAPAPSHPKGIVGLSMSDAEKVLSDLKEIFSYSANFSEFKKLLQLDSNAIKKIDSTQLAEALEGKHLNRDEQALIDLTVATINAEYEYKVEYVKGTAPISAEAEKIFEKSLNERGANIDSMKKKYPKHYISGLDLGETLNGRGMTVKTSTGTYTLIVDSNHVKLIGKDYIITETGKKILDPIATTVHITAHEILGHARSLSLNYPDQQEAGVLTENLVLRILPLTNKGKLIHIQRTGLDHGGKADGGRHKIKDYDIKLPAFIYNSH
jgi:hypothetical protein